MLPMAMSVNQTSNQQQQQQGGLRAPPFLPSVRLMRGPDPSKLSACESSEVAQPQQQEEKKREDKTGVAFTPSSEEGSNSKHSHAAVKSGNKRMVAKCKTASSLEQVPQNEIGSEIAALCLVLYLVVTVLFYHYVEGWSVRQCLYFAVTTFTTVGYGDLHPTGSGSRLFTAAIVLVGVSLIGMALGFLGRYLIRKQKRAMEAANQIANSSMRAQLGDIQEEKITENEAARIKLTAMGDVRVQLALSVFPLTISVCIFTLVMAVNEDRTFVDAFYFAIITGTSVGYGDLIPRHASSQWFCIFFMPVMVFSISYALGKIAEIPIQRDLERMQHSILNKGLNEEDFWTIGNGDGEVDKAEFIIHMLKVMNKVDEGTLVMLQERFDSLDVDGSGTLNRDDLRQAWKRSNVTTEQIRGSVMETMKVQTNILRRISSLSQPGGSSKVAPSAASLVGLRFKDAQFETGQFGDAAPPLEQDEESRRGTRHSQC